MASAGHDFWFMWNLAQKAYSNACQDQWVLQNYSPQLMVAISWEETQFNNIHQGGFTHDDWMKLWTDIDPATNKTRVNSATNQKSGNHAIGYVQAERDTIDLWLTFNPEVCLGLPGFTAEMVYRQGDKSVTTERRQARTRWFQKADEAILADDAAGFSLGWRAFSYLHTAKVISSKRSGLKVFAGKNDARDDPKKKIGRTAPQIIQGWLDTDACMRALAAMSPYQMKPEFGLAAANQAIGGAYYFSRPDGDFNGAFRISRDQALAMSKVYEPFITRGPNDSFIPGGKVPELRAALAQALGIVEGG